MVEHDPDALDVERMLRVRSGDREAFRELVNAHHARVIGTVARMLGTDTHEAEDLAQQVFLRVWKSAPRYEASAKFTTWLFTITRNLVFNEARRRKNRPTTSLETGGSDESEFAPRQFADEHAPSPQTALLEREMEEAVDAAIADLPEQQRLAVVLRRYEELPYEDIAATLELTVPAVKSLLFRARTFLRERLERYLQA
ncbi:MAG: sigma-70 family RNA polymerase sigma factor [Verrucomicrobia bacterium]|nr:sigma-70 family RNA polymerase sigma factor [Verrucomicrobiota bacterium]